MTVRDWYIASQSPERNREVAQQGGQPIQCAVSGETSLGHTLILGLQQYEPLNVV